MDNQTKNIVSMASIISGAVVISRLNPEIKDFFSSDLIVFILLTLGIFEVSKDILTALAGAVVGTMIVKIVMTQDISEFIGENFTLLYPGPNSSNECIKVTNSELLNRFNGDSNLLKQNMVESGVPHNLYLDDVNAPEIATYLINNPKINYVNDECKLIK